MVEDPVVAEIPETASPVAENPPEPISPELNSGPASDTTRSPTTASANEHHTQPSEAGVSAETTEETEAETADPTTPDQAEPGPKSPDISTDSPDDHLTSVEETTELDSSEEPAEPADDQSVSEVPNVDSSSAATDSEPLTDFTRPKIPTPPVDPRVDTGDEELASSGPKVIVAPDLAALPSSIVDDFEAAIAHTVLEFREGDIVDGKVVSVDTEGAMVDIGYKSEGLIPTPELSIRKNVDPGELVAVGDRVEALVLVKEDEEGRLLLSKKRAQYEKAWGRVNRLAQQGVTITGSVIEVVKGGLIVDIGLRGFLPASLVDLRRVRDLDQFIGQDIQAKVIELDRNRNNVVLSRRAHLEEEMAEQRQSFLDNLTEGEIREGQISSVVAFGAFVDLGGMDGLIHVSELSWHHINHPSQAVQVGDKVNVKVLEVDRERERISLSVRQTLEDPWLVFSGQNEVGSVVEGTVIKTVPYGAFLSIGDGVEGLVHVSEIAIHRVESPELELTIGQNVKAKIIELDVERRRVSFSIKQAMPEWAERKAPRKPQPEAAKPKPKPKKEREPTERQFGPPEEEERPPVAVDASLEAILAELKERGIGRR